MYAAGNTNFLFVNLTINHSEENLDSSRSKSFFWGGDYIYIYIYIYIYGERERETILCLPNSSQGLFFHLESIETLSNGCGFRRNKSLGHSVKFALLLKLFFGN